MVRQEISLFKWGRLSLLLLLALSCNADEQASRAGSRQSALRKSIATVRPSEGRLFGLNHIPFDASTRRITERSKLIRLRKSIREQSSFSDARAVADLGTVSLATGDVMGALSKLENAARESPTDASIQSDLAAVYLEAAEALGKPRYLLSALVHADTAWRTDKSVLEGGFNLALALEKLSLDLPSREVWKEYIALEKEKSWKEEAAWRLSTLKPKTGAETWEESRSELEDVALKEDFDELRQIIERSPQLARSHIEEEILGAWATAILMGQGDAASQKLKIADSVGVVLAGRDRMIRDAVDAISNAAQIGRDRLASGHESFLLGLTLYKQRNASAALPHFQRASEILQLERSPFAGWADFYSSICVYYEPDYEGAFRLLEHLERRVDGGRYPILKGRILWVMGLIQYEQGRPEISLDYYTRALHIFKLAGEQENMAAVENLLASSLDYLGLSEESWEARIRALQLLVHVSSAQRIQNIIGQAAQSLLRADNASVASYFQREGVERAKSSKDPLVSAIALCQMARIWEDLERSERARDCLGQAIKYAARVPDQRQSESIMPDILDVMGRVDSKLNPGSAEHYYSTAIARYERSNYRFRLPSLYRDRASLRLSQGRYSLAETDLRAGIAETERHLEVLTDREKSVSFQETRQDLFDDLVRLQVESGRSWQALVDSEHSRAYLPGGPPIMSSDARDLDFLRSIPEDTQFISYISLEDLLVAFVVSSDGLVVRKIECDAPLLAKRVEDLLEDLRREARDSQLSSSGELFDLLIKPLSDVLDPGRRLVIIGDRNLSAIPFAVLFNRSSGRFLIEDYAISYGPSLSWYLAMLTRTERIGVTNSALSVLKVLVVLGPSGGGTYIPALQATKSEASDVAKLFDNHVLLSGASATPGNVLELIGEFDVVHFSGHAFHNVRRPFHSWLLLQSDSGKGWRALYAHQLMELKHPKTRLVFLAACSTAGNGRDTRYGFLGLAKSFWSVGVPTIVATFSETEDQAAKEISINFYRFLLLGESAADAMRKAQLKAIQSNSLAVNSPSNWGVFGVFGV